MNHPTPHDIPTPALVIDEPTVDRNIKRLADYARQHKLNIRPHTKTHKSILMARKQLAEFPGLTVAKVGEAEVMAHAGDDLLLAYPALDRFRTARIAELAKRKTMRVSIDSQQAADAIADAARASGATVGILVDLDVGMHRTGLQTPELTLALAQHVSQTPGLRLDGLFFYPGHVWGAPQPEMAKKPSTAIKCAVIDQTLALWTQHGLEAKIVSGGSTPTAFHSHHIKGQTEIRPGTYIYYDRNCLAGNWCTIDDCAARVIVTVMSDAVPGKVIVDAGNKDAPPATSSSSTPRPATAFASNTPSPRSRSSARSTARSIFQNTPTAPGSARVCKSCRTTSAPASTSRTPRGSATPTASWKNSPSMRGGNYRERLNNPQTTNPHNS